MTTLLGIDLETTGPDPHSDSILEIGCILWHVETQNPVKMWSILIKNPQETTPIPFSSQLIHGIQAPDILEYGYPLEQCLKVLPGFFQKADYIVAHNAEFEKSFLSKIPELTHLITSKLWIDTLTDVPYPVECTKKNLEALSVSHRFVNPMPHRALPDVLVMLQILSQYNFQEVIQLSKEETTNLTAEVGSKIEQEAAKSAGFRKNYESGQWMKSVKPSRVEAEKAFILRLFPEAFTKPTHRLKALVSKDKKDLAKNLSYQWQPDTKEWVLWVKAHQLEQAILEAKPSFEVDVQAL